jgi:hypothetical protein
MVKEIVFKCDPCTSRGEDSTATHVVPVTIGTGKSQNLDLCDADYTQLLQPVVNALLEFGYSDEPVKPKRKSPAPRVEQPATDAAPAPETGAYDREGPYQCRFCEQQPKHIKSLSNHLRQVHGTTLSAFRSEYGDPVLVA